jgi:poly(hydroxyalkanoate) granule-associated protein
MVNNKAATQDLKDKGREIWLAGLGVFSTMEEEGTKLFNKFIEKGKELEKKGENIEKKARQQVQNIEKKAKETIGNLGTWDELGDYIEQKLNSTFETLGVSSHKEVKALNDKVEKLTKSVEMLSDKIEKSQKATPKIIKK